MWTTSAASSTAHDDNGVPLLPSCLPDIRYIHSIPCNPARMSQRTHTALYCLHPPHALPYPHTIRSRSLLPIPLLDARAASTLYNALPTHFIRNVTALTRAHAVVLVYIFQLWIHARPAWWRRTLVNRMCSRRCTGIGPCLESVRSCLQLPTSYLDIYLLLTTRVRRCTTC